MRSARPAHAVAVALAAVTAVTRQIARADPGAFRIISASQAGAPRDITGRRDYGAIILGGRTPRLLSVSPARPVVALLTLMISAVSTAQA